MNVNLYGCRGKWIMVDLGLTFSGHEYPGVDLVLPDLEFIEKRRGDLLVIRPGQSYDYVSGCPLTTPWGSMKGRFGMVDGGGRRFEVAIPLFVLDAGGAGGGSARVLH